MLTLLFLMALLLPSRVGAEEIIDGVEARPHSRPYMAHLKIRTYQGLENSCGGFLITRQFVMTAAHCKGREITVTLGAHNLSKTEYTQQKIRVEKQIIHPKYNLYSNLHDIMLLKVPLVFLPCLSLPFLLSSWLRSLNALLYTSFPQNPLLNSQWERSHVQASFTALTSLLSFPQQLQNKAELTPAVDVIPLPGPSDFVKPGKMCWAAGWGRTGMNKPTSDSLREVELRIMDKEACQIYRHYDYNFQVCVGSPTTLKSVYQADSGGPLVCAGVAHGIVSYGHSDGKPPAVFTRISSYMLWINTVLKGK